MRKAVTVGLRGVEDATDGVVVPGDVERGALERVDEGGVGAAGHEELRDVGVAAGPPACPLPAGDAPAALRDLVERSESAAVGAVDVGAGVEQHADDVVVAVARGVVQRRLAVLVDGVDVALLVQQAAAQRLRAAPRRVVQRRVPVVVAVARPGGAQKTLQRSNVAVRRRALQLKRQQGGRDGVGGVGERREGKEMGKGGGAREGSAERDTTRERERGREEM